MTCKTEVYPILHRSISCLLDHNFDQSASCRPNMLAHSVHHRKYTLLIGWLDGETPEGRRTIRSKLVNFYFAYKVDDFTGRMSKSYKMDGWYSWLVCFAVFAIEFIVMGFFTAFGTLFISLIQEFRVTESLAAWVGSVAFSICYLSSFTVNMLLPLLGYRAVCCLGSILFAVGLVASSFAGSVMVLFITYGVIFGSGCGLVHFSGVLVIPKFFKFKRGMAYGISLSGHGIGAWPMGYFIEILLTKYGLRTTLLLCSCLAIPLFFGGLTFGSVSVSKKCCTENKIRLEKRRQETAQPVWKNKALLANCIALWMYGFGYYIPSVHLVNMAEGLGVPLMKATLLPSSIAISQSVGKIAFGQLAMWCRQINPVYFCQGTMFICGLITTFCPLMKDFGGLLFYSVTYGFFDACSSVLVLKVIEDIVGESNIDTGYAAQMVGMAIFMLIGPPTAGFLYESTGTYEIPFFLSGAFITVCVCIMFLVPCFKEMYSTPNKLLGVIERKISVLSTSSVDSGISVRADNNRERIASWNSSSVSTLPSIVIAIDSDNSDLSDYETDEENCVNQSTGFGQNRIVNSKFSIIGKDIQPICFGSQFELHCTREDLLSAERETAV